jgi:hypothetical protein
MVVQCRPVLVACGRARAVTTRGAHVAALTGRCSGGASTNGGQGVHWAW